MPDVRAVRVGRAGGGAPALARLLALLACLSPLSFSLPPAAAARPAAPAASPPAVIDTLAGGGAVGDGGPALRARLNLPGGVTEAPDGDLVVVDFGNHRVRRIDRRSGIIRTIAGTGEAGYNGDGIPAARARLARPEYAVFGPRGDLFIADSYNNRIRRVDPATGLISTVAGCGERGAAGDGGPATAAQLHFPEGIAVDGQGNLFIADTVNRRVRRVDAATGIIAAYAGSGEVGVAEEGVPALAARFLRLARIAVDRSGNLYIADSPAHRILIVDAATRTLRTFAGNGEQGFSGDGGAATAARLAFPEGVTVAPDGDIYFADTGNHRIRKVAARTGTIATVAGTGEKGFAGDGGPALAARFWSPGRVWVDRAGGVLIADNLNSRIRRVAPGTGIVSTVAGTGEWGDGGPADQATLSVPGGVAYAAGKVYVADFGTRRVRVIDLATRRIDTVAGGGVRTGEEGIAATAAELLLPEGIAVDGQRALYIADSLASRVWRVDLATGILHPFAGIGVAGDAGDDGPATAARLCLPSAVAVGPDGAIYISDFGNRAVRVVDAATGVIRRLRGAAAVADPLRVGVTSLAATAAGLYHLVHGEGEVRLFDLERRELRPLPALAGLAPAPSGDSQVIDLAVHEPFVYLADPLAHRVVRLDLETAEVAVVAGDGVQGLAGDGGPAARASLFQPGGIAVTDDGSRLFVADTKNHRIREVRLLASPEAAAPPPDAGVTRFRLLNGLALLVAVRPGLGLAAVNLTVDLGSIDDPPHQAGMAHLLEHVTLSGSTRVGSLDPAAEAAALDELDRAVQALARGRPGPGTPGTDPGTPGTPDTPEIIAGLERRVEQAEQASRRTAEDGEIIGGRLEARGAIGTNATTTADATQFFTWIPAGELALWVSLEAERLQSPVFRRFYSERDVVLREVAGLTGGRATPQERFMEELFPGGRQSRPLAGNPDDIRAIDRPAALAYFHRFYRPERTAIAVVGDVDPEQVRRLVERHFGGWRPEGAAELPAARTERVAGPQAGRGRAFNSVRNPIVFLAFPRPPGAVAGSAEDAALEVLAELVDAEDLSPLRRRLVDEQGAAWSVGAAPSYPAAKQASVFLVHVYGNPGVAHAALARDAAALLVGLGGADDADVEGAILKTEMRLAGQLDDPPSLASLLALHEAVGGDWTAPWRRLEAVRRTRAEDVRAAARRLFATAADAAAEVPGR